MMRLTISEGNKTRETIREVTKNDGDKTRMLVTEAKQDIIEAITGKAKEDQQDEAFWRSLAETEALAEAEAPVGAAPALEDAEAPEAEAPVGADDEASSDGLSPAEREQTLQEIAEEEAAEAEAPAQQAVIR